MSTLGQKPATRHVSTEKQSITGNGGTSYTLQQSVSQASDIEVFVNNTRQEPTVAYTASGTTLTMTGAVNASDSFYVIFQGKAIQTAGLPVDAAITASTITTSQTITSTGNIITSGTVNTPSINGGQIGGRRNLIINGAMQVAQRGTSFTSTADLYTLDRFAIGHGTVNAMTVTQETDAPSGFQYSLKVLTGTGASSGAAGYGVLRQAIEGTNMYQLKFGTSDAESVTLSFYVKSSLTGTFAVSIRNQAGNRAFAATYTISSANTWEYKTITIAGDTSGTWTADTGIGLHVQFDLGAGSNYDIATGAWTSGSNMFGGESTVKLTETTNATWFLTGLQVEVGSTATSFEHRSFGEEEQLCFRYCRKFDPVHFGRARDGDSFYGGGLPFFPPFRATPTLKSGADYAVNTGSGGAPAINGGLGPGAHSVQMYNSSANWTTNAFPRLINAVFEAEL